MSGDGSKVEIKGVAFRGTLDFVRDRKGDEGVSQVIGKLPEEAQTALSKPILASAFYPFPWLVEMQRAVVEVVGGRSEDVLFEMGRFVCRQAMTGVYKIFIKVGSTEYILRKSTTMAATYFRGLGDNCVEMLELEKNRGLMKFDRIPGSDANYCRRLHGFFETLLVMSGANDVKVVESCCAYRGAERCEWTATWS